MYASFKKFQKFILCFEKQEGSVFVRDAKECHSDEDQTQVYYLQVLKDLCSANLCAIMRM